MGEKIKSLVIMGELTMEMEYIKHALIASDVDFMNPGCFRSIKELMSAIHETRPQQIVCVGCQPFDEHWEGNESRVFIDHRLNSDEYTSSGRYWFSSFIGKTMEWLFANTDDAEKLMQKLYLAGYDAEVAELIAAASYNLIDAYKGSLVKVSPKDILDRRVGFIARQNKCSQEDVMLKIVESKSIIESAPKIDLCGTSVADLRGFETSEFLSEASALIGCPFISSRMENNHTKVSIHSASVEQLEYFGEVFAHKVGLSNVTKDPVSYQAFGFM